jgi:cold-inducible RNA-binding protein
MAKKLYVGNLSYDMDEEKLRKLFADFGTVESANIITDRDTGRSKGFGFVELGSDEETKAAIAALDGKEIDGRTLKVNEAREKGDSRGGGGGRRDGGMRRNRY